MAVLNDPRLSNDAKVAFCVMLDCARDGFAKIGYPRLGERLGISRRKTWIALRQLVATGHIQNCEATKGKGAVYKLLTSSTGDTTSSCNGDTGVVPKWAVTSSKTGPEVVPLVERYLTVLLIFSLRARPRTRGTMKKRKRRKRPNRFFYQPRSTSVR